MEGSFKGSFQNKVEETLKGAKDAKKVISREQIEKLLLQDIAAGLSGIDTTKYELDELLLNLLKTGLLDDDLQQFLEKEIASYNEMMDDLVGSNEELAGLEATIFTYQAEQNRWEEIAFGVRVEEKEETKKIGFWSRQKAFRERVNASIDQGKGMLQVARWLKLKDRKTELARLIEEGSSKEFIIKWNEELKEIKMKMKQLSTEETNVLKMHSLETAIEEKEAKTEEVNNNILSLLQQADSKKEEISQRVSITLGEAENPQAKYKEKVDNVTEKLGLLAQKVESKDLSTLEIESILHNLARSFGALYQSLLRDKFQKVTSSEV